MGRQQSQGVEIGWLKPPQIIEDAKNRVPTPIMQHLSMIVTSTVYLKPRLALPLFVQLRLPFSAFSPFLPTI